MDENETRFLNDLFSSAINRKNDPAEIKIETNVYSRTRISENVIRIVRLELLMWMIFRRNSRFS
jgi:hypothetical protein